MARHFLVFTAHLARFPVLAVGPDADLPSFTVREDDVAVRIDPIVHQHYQHRWTIRRHPGDPEQEQWARHEFSLLARLSATIEVEDTSADLADEVVRAHRPRAELVLRQTLSHLRAITGCPEIDVRLASLRLTRQTASPLDRTEREQEWELAWVPTPNAVLSEQDWKRVAERVQTACRVPPERDWLLDARAFLLAQHRNMALAAAAISCEVALHKLVRRRLTADGHLTKKQTDAFVEEVSNRQLPMVLLSLGVLSADEANMIRDTFNLRNAILHGKRHAPVSPKDADDAIRCAERLLELSESDA